MKNDSIDILKDLEDIYTLALAHEKFAVALKAKELLGKAQGVFSDKKKAAVSLSDLSDEDLKRLMGEIEKELGLDPNDRRDFNKKNKSS